MRGMEYINMSEEAIIRHCSPTLAGLKTGNMFNCAYESREAMREAICAWNRKLRAKGIRVLPLRYKDGSALIYMYRPSMLSKDMENKEACRILAERGYDLATCERRIVHLIERLSVCPEFPHEIGLFLGYPPEDVCGFIENRACGCKCTGCWKVYGDREKAEKTFSRYKKCTRIYLDQWEKGKSIERLTVTV